MFRFRHGCVAASVAVLLVACGADKQAPPPTMPASPTSPGYPAQPSADAPASAGARPESLQQRKSDAPAPYPAEAPDPTVQRSLALRSARKDFDDATTQLLAQLSDCALACRSLGALERAAGKLCELSKEPEELARCEDAKQRVFVAKQRVRATCSECRQ